MNSGCRPVVAVPLDADSSEARSTTVLAGVEQAGPGEHTIRTQSDACITTVARPDLPTTTMTTSYAG
jgi:hypothetical protein